MKNAYISTKSLFVAIFALSVSPTSVFAKILSPEGQAEYNAVFLQDPFQKLQAKARKDSNHQSDYLVQREEAISKAEIGRLFYQLAEASKTDAKDVFLDGARRNLGKIQDNYFTTTDAKYLYAQLLLKYGQETSFEFYDRQKAIEILKNLVKAKHAEAAATLGYFFMRSMTSAEKLIEIPKATFGTIQMYLEIGALHGSVRAVTLLGVLYLETSDTENGKDGISRPLRDEERALHLLNIAAKLGDPLAYRNLAYMYSNGIGVAKDLQKAKEFTSTQVALENSLRKKYTNDWMKFCGGYFKKDLCTKMAVFPSVSPATVKGPIELLNYRIPNYLLESQSLEIPDHMETL